MLSAAIILAAAVAGEPPTAPLSAYATIELAGFTVRVHSEAGADAARERRVRAALLFDLETVARSVPADALEALREIPIVITPATGARPGFSGRGMCFHESAAWLTGNGFDAEREGTVEICNMDDFLLWRAEQPMMTLHELAHAFHWKVGFGREDVRRAFAGAREAGLYEAVGYAMAPNGERRRAYALNNHKEYFAELTEAYFGRNDFFPHTREELRAYDPEGYAVVERVWSLRGDEIRAASRRRGP